MGSQMRWGSIGPPPRSSYKDTNGSVVSIKVRLLDDTVAVFHLGHKSEGRHLIDEVYRHLNILEVDYFGLEFIDANGSHCWLERDKPIFKQINTEVSDAKFYFIVKFYTPNSIDLEEEYTRYLFTLQVKRDLAVGDLLCSESTAALLAAYLVQSECGDFSPEDYPDASYLSHSRFVPNQTYEFQQKVMDNHRNLIGMTPGESDLALLEVARRCDFYGVKLHLARDIEGTEASLTVLHLGIKVFHQLHCVSTFSWAKIRKLSFKRKKLLIKLHPDAYQYYKETIEFVFENRNECKNFWKKCVEHHAFFRCTQVEDNRKEKRFLSKGSSFKYHGKTQRQLVDYVREHHKRREPFTRPLRSGLSSRAFTSSAYATVTDGHPARNATHYSMPHIPLPSSAAVTANGADPTDTGYGILHRKRKLTPGINTTFFAESVCQSEPGGINMNASLDCLSSVSGGYSLKYLSSRNTFSSSHELVKESTIDEESKVTNSMDDEIDNALRIVNSPVVSMDENEYLRFRPKASLKDVAEQLLCDQRQTVKDLTLLVDNLYPKIQASISECKILQELFTSLIDLHKQHTVMLEQLEEIMLGPSDGIFNGLSPLLLLYSHNLALMYANLIRQYPIYISAYDELRSSQNAFRCIITQFEKTPECYIPVHWVLLKTINNMLNWQKVIAEMIELLLTDGKSDADLTSLRISLEKISQFSSATEKPRQMLADYTSLVAIEEALAATSTLCHPDRKILRVGYVQRWSGQLVPRILLLCTDCILFAHRTQKSFVLNANLKLKGLLMDDGDSCHLLGELADSAITLHSEGKSIVIVTHQHLEWIRDINEAVKAAAKSRIQLPLINIDKSVPEIVNESDPDNILYVLWHRRTSISGLQLSQSVTYSKCGYLLRKLRNARGWQRLWVLLTNNCLFFYASHEKLTPIASLSLIDYGVGLPRSEDMIRHPCCIRLFYAKHNYFFRANNEFSFESWLTALRRSAINEFSHDL